MTSIANDNTPSLAVVVCVHNAKDYAEICLDSVLRHTPEPYQLIIVNDGSRADTSKMLSAFAKQYAHCRLLTNATAQGYTKAANQGLRASRADYTVLLNSDTIVSPGWAERLIACGESDINIGIIGPLSNAATYQSVPEVFDGRGHWKQNELPGDLTVSAYAKMVATVAAKTYPRVPVANGFCFAVKRAVIQAIGYLDEETFPRGYGEENDYCIRAAEAGFSIAVADDVYVYHAVSKSFGVGNREALTRDAHHAIRAKHGEAKLAAIDAALRNHSSMEAVRARIQKRHHAAVAAGSDHRAKIDFAPANSTFSVYYLLLDCSPHAGGTQVVVETARGLSDLGVKVRIAVKEAVKDDYLRVFPGDDRLFYFYERERDLIDGAKDADVAIATIFHSIKQLAAIVARYPGLCPAYFVQDYEPWFLDEHPKLKALAELSYTMLPGNHLIAISQWVCQQITSKHGTPVAKVRGSLDQSLFYPDYTKPQGGPVVVSAMIRPSTPWRSPRLTMDVLETLNREYGERVRIQIFGAEERDLAHHGLNYDFAYQNFGKIGRFAVASVLRHSDVFLDLSAFQAFGRTALEAMACGAAVVAPIEGGVGEYGVAGKNLLLADTSSKDACLEAARKLVDQPALRAQLSAAAIETGADYSIHRSSLSLLESLIKAKAARAERRKAA